MSQPRSGVAGAVVEEADHVLVADDAKQVAAGRVRLGEALGERAFGAGGGACFGVPGFDEGEVSRNDRADGDPHAGPAAVGALDGRASQPSMRSGIWRIGTWRIGHWGSACRNARP